MQIRKAAPGNITGHFGDTDVPGAHVKRHTGMDIGHGNMTAADRTVISPAPGVVLAAGWLGTYGNRLTIGHADSGGHSWVSLLAHLDSIAVEVGDTVDTTQIAVMGDTGGNWPVHLHQELWRDGVPVDPEDYLSAPADGGNTTPIPGSESTLEDEEMPDPIYAKGDKSPDVYALYTTVPSANPADPGQGAVYAARRKVEAGEYAIVRAIGFPHPKQTKGLVTIPQKDFDKIPKVWNSK